MSKGEKEDQEILQAVQSNVDRVALALNISLEPNERLEIVTALKQLCSHVNPWALRNAEFISGQVELAEAPQAVTWKEYDKFVERFALKQERKTTDIWILEHSAKVESPKERVYSETLNATIGAFTKTLREADMRLVETDKEPTRTRAEVLLTLLESLVVNDHGLSDFAHRASSEDLKRLFEGIGSLVRAASETHSSLWSRCEAMLFRTIEQWTEDVRPLMHAIPPYNPLGFTHYEGGTVRALHAKMSATLLPKFAHQVIESFRESGFIDRLFQENITTFDTRSVIFDPDGPMWKELQGEVLAVLGEAPSNRMVQENAYELLYWCDYKLREQKGYGEPDAKNLLSNAQIVLPLWRAATATPLGPAAIARLQKFPDEVKELGSTVDLPVWWTAAIAAFPPRKDAAPPVSGEGPLNTEGQEPV